MWKKNKINTLHHVNISMYIYFSDTHEIEMSAKNPQHIDNDQFGIYLNEEVSNWSFGNESLSHVSEVHI